MDSKTLQVFLGLSLATACTALARESDIIWFPVDDEEGVFVSSYGEKYRTNWNSRKARFSEDYESPRMSKQLKNFDEIRELLSNPRDPRLNEIPTRSTVRPKFMTSKNRRNVRVSSMNDFEKEEVVPIGRRYRLFLNKNRPTERPTKFIQIPYQKPKQNLISEIFDVHRTTTESYQSDESWPARPNENFQLDQNWPVRPNNRRPTNDDSQEEQNWPARPNRPTNDDSQEEQNWPARPNRPTYDNSQVEQSWPARPNRPTNDDSQEEQNWPARPNRPTNDNSQEEQNWPTRPTNDNFQSEKSWSSRPNRPTNDNPDLDQDWPPRPNNQGPTTENQNWPSRPNIQRPTNENPQPEQNWPARPNRPTNENQNWQNNPSPFPEVKPVTEETWEGRPSTDSDKLIFPDDGESGSSVTTESAFIPQTTTQSDCERSCQVTPEFNPVCGSDFNNYSNIGRLKCAQMCGKRVELVHHGNCGRTREIRPPAQRTDPVLVWS